MFRATLHNNELVTFLSSLSRQARRKTSVGEVESVNSRFSRRVRLAKITVLPKKTCEGAGNGERGKHVRSRRYESFVRTTMSNFPFKTCF